MRKRGARIKYRARAHCGLIAQSVNPAYETRLRMAVESIRGGWAEPTHFNDLADTIDLLQLGIALYPAQRPDPNTAAAVEIALIALRNIRDRHQDRGKIGATGEELKALELLVDASLDYWNRRSGALYAEAYRQLGNIRKHQMGLIE